MAYRRRQGITRASTFKEEITSSGASSANGDVDDNQQQPQHRRVKSSASVSSSSLAARAIKASAAHRDSSGFGYAYGYGGVDSFFPSSDPDLSLSSFPKASFPTESTSVKGSDDSKYGFWGILARKAKSVLEDENNLNPYESSDKTRQQTTSTWTQYHQSHQSSERGERMNDTKLRKGLDAFTSSLNRIGDTIGNALEEGRTIVEHKTADIIQETCNKTADIIQETQKLHIRRRGGGTDTQDQATVLQSPWQRPAAIEPAHTLANQQTQLKASRDVAMATAAKAKVLLRELKTVKADLAFAKERCAQLEEENKRLRDSREKGDNPADDDLIRLQLETLLAEKARLAHENSIYARENRFLREIVEYHQLTMQDIVYLDEGAEEVTEVYPFSIDDAKVLSSIPTSPTSPTLLPEVGTLICPPEAKEEHTSGVAKVVSNSSASPSSPISPRKLSPEGEGNVQEREMYPIPISIAMDGDPKRSSNSHA